MNERKKRTSPKVAVSMMCLNSNVRDELYEILYGQSLFLLHTSGLHKHTITYLSDRALKHITHVTISFIAAKSTKAQCQTISYQEALKHLIVKVGKLVPGTQYLGVNFWSFQLEPRFAIDKHPKMNTDATTERPDFRDTAFISRTLTDFVTDHPSIQTFALLRNMQPRGHLNWGRENKATVKKALARDIKKCMAKVYCEDDRQRSL